MVFLILVNFHSSSMTKKWKTFNCFHRHFVLFSCLFPDIPGTPIPTSYSSDSPGFRSQTFSFTQLSVSKVSGSAMCLICKDKISLMKRSNIKRHFDTRHATFASKYPVGDSRKKACQELLCRVQANQQQLCVWTRQGDWNSSSFAGSLAIVRNGKPFIDGEYAKTFMLDETQVKDINAAPFFSLALDESTDVSHISQFSVIARYVAGDTLHEQSLAVLPMKGTTRGEDLFKSFIEFAKEKNLPMDKLISLCTDGAPCMVGKNRGFVALLREHENRPILRFHCILHQEELCAQMCGEQLGEVMSLVIQMFNFTFARALNDRQSKTLLDEVGNSYPSLLLHSNVRWLLRVKVLSRFAACMSEIQTFFKMKNVEYPELANTEWLLKFFYLVDMTEHLNQLNVKMQGVGNTYPFNKRCLHLKTSWNSSLWILKQVTLNEDLERLARQQAELVSEHKWTEMKKLQHADQLIVKTWNALPVTYRTLQRVSIAVLTMFGSRYACEQSFSHLKNIKTNLRSHLPDGSLNAFMKLNLTTYQPDYKAISKTMQRQKSH
uniref:HAT C-terminal dimerisation domain-containing protein n=1 Tax=Kryptolebias marmoratus TaxID=37003 RepID=A0A3Q3AU70_KRYMA